MRLLIVDGWTEEGNRSHTRAGCVTQASVFESLIREYLPAAEIRIVDTHASCGPANLDPGRFDAAVWTGGGGNIYEDSAFNRRQLGLCERVLAEVRHVWGSCWGFQVLTSVCGGKVAPARTPEIGIATGIKVRAAGPAGTIYRGKPAVFDAPAHHFDEIAQLPGDFKPAAENGHSVQAAMSRDGRIFCTQYHPELPYDYIGRLLAHWAAKYRSLFTEEAFRILLADLKTRERKERDLRKVEFGNWLAFLRQGRRRS